MFHQPSGKTPAEGGRCELHGTALSTPSETVTTRDFEGTLRIELFDGETTVHNDAWAIQVSVGVEVRVAGQVRHQVV